MTAHREGVWTDVAEGPRTATTDWRRLALEWFGVGLVAIPVAAFALPIGLALPVGGIVLGGGTLGLMARHLDDRKRAMSERAKALRDEFGVGPVWTVDLMVRQGEVPTGRDEGLLWVEDGRIVFSGLRTSFALVPGQAAGAVQHLPRLSGLRHRLNLALARETDAGPLSLSFWPLASSLQRAESDAADLRYALNTVADRRDHTLEASGQWPPMARGPGGSSRRDLLLRALAPPLGGVLLGLVGFGLFLPNVVAGVVTLLVLAVGLNLACYGESRPRWQAYRDARRLGP